MGDFFAFRKMITGFVIQVVFVIGLVGIVIGSIGAIANDQPLVGLALLVFGTLYWRILCEVLIVFFRMNTSLIAIRANTEGLGPALPPSGGGPDPGSAREERVAPIAAAAAAIADTATAALPPQGWYDDSERPGHTRWWDGTAWGIRDDEHPSGAGGNPHADAETATTSTATAGEPTAEVTPASSSAPEPASEQPAKRFCENCGAERPPGSRFCTSCGHA